MKFVCQVCGYVHEGDSAPEKCPVCNAPAEKFTAQGDEKVWAAEHVVGVAKGVSEDIMADLRANFNGECTEVGMYLAMARVAHREGYPEIGLYWEKAAWEEAEHAAKFAELLGEVVTDSTKKNLETIRLNSDKVLFSFARGRERCDRNGHAVFLRPRVDFATTDSEITGISTSSTKLK